MRFVKLVVLVGSLVVGVAPGRGQTPSSTAEQMFREGKRLMDEGNVAEACVAFDGSYRHEPVVSTLLNLANCREANHQFASAWGGFIDAARITRGQAALIALNQTAVDRAARLEPRLSYLIINVRADVQEDGLIVTRDGTVVDAAEWNLAIPIDGGEYTIEAKAPAHESWSTVVKVGDAKDKQSVDVPRFQPLHERPDAPATGVGSPMPTKRKVAIAAWVVGGAVVAGAIAFELSGRSTYDDAKAATDNPTRGELYDSANRKHTLALVSGGIAVAAVGTGVWLWLSAKSSTEVDRTARLIVPIAHGGDWSLAIEGQF